MPGTDDSDNRGQHPNSRANLRQGNPGNRGNPLGRALTTQEFRAKAREEATKRLDIILGIIDNAPRDRDALEAYKMLAKYAGLEVDLVAQTDSLGNDVDLIDREALLAIARAEAESDEGEAPGSPE